MLLRGLYLINYSKKSLSKAVSKTSDHRPPCIKELKGAKALFYARLPGSLTVEAAFVTPLVILAAAAILGLMPMLTLQSQVNSGLQYVSRTMAAECTDEDSENSYAAMLSEGTLLFIEYISEHGCRENIIDGGMYGISLAESDFSGEYITLTASYEVELPVSFWGIGSLPVTQSVRSRKWIGDSYDEDEDSDGTYVYVTKTGTAYHSSTSCSYLDLTIQSVSYSQVSSLRNKSGGIYYACSCYEAGDETVYITDYGTNYHSSLSCSGLVRTIYRISIDDVGSRHACSKCW